MTTDVFGYVHLGYAVIETNKFDDWKRFGRDAIGMHLDEMLPDTIRFRLDANECRFLLRRGPAEDVVALGWTPRRPRDFRRDLPPGRRPRGAGRRGLR